MTGAQEGALFERTTVAALGLIGRIDSAHALALEQEIAGMSAGEQLDRVIRVLLGMAPRKPAAAQVAPLCAEDRKLLDETREAIDRINEAWHRLRYQCGKKT